MKTKFITYAPIFLVFLFCSCSTYEAQNKVQKMETETLRITASLSESQANHLARLVNLNRAEIYIEYFNYSEEVAVFQEPISQWNLFLTVIDKNNKIIDSKNLKFVTPVIDDSIYIELQPNEKRVFKFLVSDFGTYKVNFNKVKKFVIKHMPQDTDCDMYDNGLILNEFTLEYYLM